MTPAQFRQDCANAFDWRNRDQLEQAIRAFTDPDLSKMSIERLEERRNLLHVQLAAVNDHLGRAVRIRRATLRTQYEADEARQRISDGLDGDADSLEPST